MFSHSHHSNKKRAVCSNECELNKYDGLYEDAMKYLNVYTELRVRNWYDEINADKTTREIKKTRN